MSPEWFESASTMSLPLCSTVFLISIPCAEKNPFWMPRSSGRALAIGRVSTVIVTASALCAVPGRPAAEPLNTSSVTASTRTAPAPSSLVGR